MLDHRCGRVSQYVPNAQTGARLPAFVCADLGVNFEAMKLKHNFV